MKKFLVSLFVMTNIVVMKASAEIMRISGIERVYYNNGVIYTAKFDNGFSICDARWSEYFRHCYVGDYLDVIRNNYSVSNIVNITREYEVRNDGRCFKTARYDWVHQCFVGLDYIILCNIDIYMRVIRGHYVAPRPHYVTPRPYPAPQPHYVTPRPYSAPKPLYRKLDDRNPKSNYGVPNRGGRNEFHGGGYHR